MLFSKTNNKTLLSIFTILVEVLIGFSTFAIFFGIFMICIMTNYESITFYKIGKTYMDNTPQIKQLINNNPDIKDLQKNVSINETAVNSHNAIYDNKLIYIIVFMIICLLCVIILPLLLGIIRLEQINFSYILVSTILHVVLIVGFELLFLLFIITYINPVKLYLIFQHNRDTTGNYLGIIKNIANI
jgi:hypothetical protein